MEKFKGTPGPWELYVKDSMPPIAVGPIKGNGKRSKIAMPPIMTDNASERMANIQLIATAPELLEALQLLIDNGFQIPSNKDMDYAKSIIKKALSPPQIGV